jgi:hypothetical protein
VIFDISKNTVLKLVCCNFSQVLSRVLQSISWLGAEHQYLMW